MGKQGEHGLDAEGLQAHTSWGRLLPAKMKEKLEQGKGKWYQQGFRATISEEAGSRGCCMLQCSKCMRMLSGGNPSKCSMHECKAVDVQRVRKGLQQLVEEDEASPSKRGREEAEEAGQPPAKKGPLDSWAVSAWQQQQFHRYYLIHLIKQETPFMKLSSHGMQLYACICSTCMQYMQCSCTALARACTHVHVHAHTAELGELELGDWPLSMAGQAAGLKQRNYSAPATQLQILRHSNPARARNFWAVAVSTTFPRISIAAQKLTSAHVTTAAAERNWSAWGRTYDSLRNNLSVKKAEKLIYIKSNMPKSWLA